MDDELPLEVIDAAIKKAATGRYGMAPVNLFGVDSYLLGNAPDGYDGPGERVTIFDMGDGRRAIRRDRDGAIQILGPSHHPDGGKFIVGKFVQLNAAP